MEPLEFIDVSVLDRVVSARRAIGFVCLGLGTAALLDSGPLLNAASSLPNPERGVVRAVASPLDSFAKSMGLDQPRRGLLSLLGRPADSAPSELLAPPAPPATAVSVVATHAPNLAANPKPLTQLPPLAPGTKAHPLRVLVTGDSLSQYLGQQIIDMTARSGTIVGKVSVHNGTGLARPDVFDWARGARVAIGQSRPSVVVVALGANDDQGIALPGPRAVQPGTPEWGAEYQRRAEIVMRIMVEHGKRRVYWMGLPVVRDKARDARYRQLNQALRAAAASIPGVHFVDTRPLSLVQGRFSDYLYANGHRVLAREPDGVHFTYEGSRFPAEKVLETAAPDLHYPH